MQQLSRALGQVDTLVNHGLSELRGGASPQHVLRQVALMGALVGAGLPVDRAIREVERAEAQLVGTMGPWERAETAFHPGFTGQAFGKPTFTGQAFGKPMGLGQAFGKPMGLGQTFGKPTYGGQAFMAPGMMGMGFPMAKGQQMGQVWQG